jgi:hypothetical protein
MDNPDSSPDCEVVFRPRETEHLYAVLWLVGGIAAFGVAAVGFVVSLAIRFDPFSLQFFTTLPTLCGFWAIVTAWTIARSPREVGIGPDGVRIVRRGDVRLHAWDEIGWSMTAVTLPNRRLLKLYDPRGKMFAKLSNALGDFDLLVKLIDKRIAAKGGDTAGRIQLAKAKRTAVFTGLFGIVFLGAAGAMAWMAHDEMRGAQLLEKTGVQGMADIEERFLAPDGVTSRLVYRVTAPDGRSGTHNAEVTHSVWKSLEGAKTVPVIYVPEEPSISRLEFGEVKEDDLLQRPLTGYGVPAIGAVMSLFFLAMAALYWRGWGLDLDSQSGRFSIKRFGTGR